MKSFAMSCFPTPIPSSVPLGLASREMLLQQFLYIVVADLQALQRRQLRNVLCTMLALRESDYLTLEDFDESWLDAGGPRSARRGAAELDPAALAAEDDGDVLSSAECDALRRTLETCNWNVSAVAVRLNLSRKTVYRKMHRHGLVRPDLGRAPQHAAGDEGLVYGNDGSTNRFHDGTPAVISDRR